MTLHVPEDDPAHSDDPERATERSTERSVERLHSHGSASSALEPKAGVVRRTGDALLSRFGLDDGSWQQRAARALEDVELGTLAGYRLVRVVARGAQGTVYEAVEPRTSRRVAIKQLRDSATGELSAREMARFERETTALAGLGHPNVVTLLAAPDDHRARLIVMEWIDGTPIDAWAARVFESRPLREAVQCVVAAIESVALGVAAAHARGVAHRDLKPSNVLVDAQGVPKILDFGIAVDLSESHDSTATTVGQTTTFAGTPAWAAPEQVAGAATRIDARVDVHALGLLLAATLSGKAPFDASLGIEALFGAIARSPVAPPSRARRGIPRELDLVVAHATEKEPKRRYQTAAALADDLARWRRGEPVVAHPPELAYTLRKFVRRHPVATIAATAAALLLATTSVLALRAAILERDARESAVESERDARDARDRAERMNGYFRSLLAEVREKEDATGTTTARDLLALASERLTRERLSDEARRDLHETLLDAYAALGDYRSAIREALDALTLVTADDDRSRGRVLAALGNAQNRLGAGAEARTTLEAALAALDTHDAKREGDLIERSSRIAVLVHLADVHRRAARVDLAFEAIDNARTMLDPGISPQRLSVVGFEAVLWSWSGDHEKGYEIACALVEEGEPLAAKDPLAFASVLHNAGWIAVELGRFDEALKHLRRAIELREEHREAAAPLTNTRVLVSLALAGLGDVDGAIANLESHAETAGSPRQLANRGLARLYLERNAAGDVDRAFEAAIDGAGHFLGRDSDAGMLALRSLQVLGKIVARASDAAWFETIERSTQTLLDRGADPLFQPYILGEIALTAAAERPHTTDPKGWRSLERSILEGVTALRAAHRGSTSECLLSELFAMQARDLARAQREPEGTATASTDPGRVVREELEELRELEARSVGLFGPRSATTQRIASERARRERGSAQTQ